MSTEPKVVLVAGVHGRTGTSLVRRLLCEHPQVVPVCHTETAILEAVTALRCDLSGSGYSPMGAYRSFIAFSDHIRAKFGDTPKVGRLLLDLVSALGGQYGRIPGLAAGALFPALSEQTLNASLNQFLNGLLSKGHQTAEELTYCEKTPSNAQYLWTARQVLPGSRFVILVRNPLAVALSHTVRDWGPHDPVEAARYTAAYFARWRAVAEDDTDWQLIRHEHLVASPEESFRRILDWVDLQPTPSLMTRVVSEVRPSRDRVGELDPRILSQMRSVLEEELVAFGYSSAEDKSW